MSTSASTATGAATERPRQAPPSQELARGRRRRSRKSLLLGVAFVAPTFLVLGYFLYYPAYVALAGSLTEWDGFNPPIFVGLGNFVEALTDDNALRIAALNNVPWAIGKILLAVLPPFLVAELIFHVRRQRWQYLYRTLFVVPLVIPAIVTILVWRFYYRDAGVLNQILGAIGLDGLQRVWLGDPDTALAALIFMGFPWVAPFNLLIFYSGLQAIPGEILEAAALDGATGWRRILRIDVPLLMSQTRVLVTLAVIGSVQALLEPLILTRGGPNNATLTPILHVYNTGVSDGEYGYSMAVSLILFVVVLVLSLLSNRLFQSRRA